MNPVTDPYDDHANAAMDCMEAAEKVTELKSNLAKAERNLLHANSVYAAAHEALDYFQRGAFDLFSARN